MRRKNGARAGRVRCLASAAFLPNLRTRLPPPSAPSPQTKPHHQIQGQRVEVAKLDAERAALSRLDKIRVDQGARAAALEKEAAASEERASLIEYNLEAVDAAIDAVNAGGDLC